MIQVFICGTKDEYDAYSGLHALANPVYDFFHCLTPQEAKAEARRSQKAGVNAVALDARGYLESNQVKNIQLT